MFSSYFETYPEGEAGYLEHVELETVVGTMHTANSHTSEYTRVRNLLGVVVILIAGLQIAVSETYRFET